MRPSWGEQRMDGMLGGYLRAGLMASSAIVCVATATPALAQTRNFNVTEQNASSGVAQFARQADIQLLISARDAQGRRTNAVRGAMPVEAGLQRLLAGTGLRAQATGAQTFSVVPIAGEAAAAGASAGNESVDPGAVSEILVIGSRSQNVDIARSEDASQPYVVFDRAEIERTPADNLEDFLRRRLPQNTQASSNAQGFVDGSGASSVVTQNNVSQINLRGLGVDETLILIDGRRAPRVANLPGPSASFGQTDINGIPLSAIERIEILPSTAGGIYGGGATGGVINIVRRRDYTGIDARVGYEGTFRGGGETFRAELSGGFTPDSGNTQVTFSASYSNSRPLYAGDNDLARRARERFYSIPTNIAAPLGATPNIVAQSVFDIPCIQSGRPIGECQVTPNLVLDPALGGIALNSPFTSVPLGYLGVSSDNGAALVANAGRYNLDLFDGPGGSREPLRNNPQIWSANLNLRREVTSSLDIFADLSFSENQGRATAAVGGLSSITLPASAPNNPFQQNILVQIPIGIEGLLRSRSRTKSALGGFIWRIAEDWALTGEYSWGQSTLSARNDNPTVNSALYQSSIRNGALNPIVDLATVGFDVTSFLVPAAGRFGPVTSVTDSVSARASGTLLHLPGGRITLSALAERRSEELREFSNVTGVTAAPSTSVTTGARQVVDSAYAEANVPFVTSRNARPGFQLLEFTAALRFDRYRTRVTLPALYFIAPGAEPPPLEIRSSAQEALSYTLAARWSPIEDIIVRGSYATGVLPPNLPQLSPGAPSQADTNNLFGTFDPRRGNEQLAIGGLVERISGGNLDVRPERSRSFSVGLIATPGFLPGLRLSFDATLIRKRDEIRALSILELLTNEDVFSTLVVRAPLTPEDQALGFTAGRIISLRTVSTNFARTDITSFDLSADYRIESRSAGLFHIYAIVTHQSDLKLRLLAADPLRNFVGFAGGPLSWRGNAGVNWTVGSLDIGWNAQFYDSYSVRRAVDPNDSGSNDNVARQGSERIPSQIYHDLNVRYRFGDSISSVLRGVELSAGVQNLFDSRPPVRATGAAVGTYSAYGDPRLRRYTLSLRRSFGR